MLICGNISDTWVKCNADLCSGLKLTESEKDYLCSLIYLLKSSILVKARHWRSACSLGLNLSCVPWLSRSWKIRNWCCQGNFQALGKCLCVCVNACVCECMCPEVREFRKMSVTESDQDLSWLYLYYISCFFTIIRINWNIAYISGENVSQLSMFLTSSSHREITRKQGYTQISIIFHTECCSCCLAPARKVTKRSAYAASFSSKADMGRKHFALL